MICDGPDADTMLKTVRGEVPADVGIDFAAGVTLKKLWSYCQSAAPAAAGQQAPVPAALDDEKPLPEGVPEAIEKAWMRKYNFHLSGARLLSGGDHNRA